MKKKDLNLFLEQYNIRDNDRDIKHYAPANKEWKNSVYTYNKSSLLNMVSKDQKAAAIIKSYFNLTPLSTKKIRSKRLRDLSRRSSTKQFFVSKPEIKQNNDKIIITVYTHDREKVAYLKKLYMLNRWLNCNILTKKKLRKERKKSRSFLINRYDITCLLIEKIFHRFRQVKRTTHRNILKIGSRKYRIKYRFVSNITKSLLKKKHFFNNLALYRFFKWALSLFYIEINIIPNAESTKTNKIINLILTVKKKDNEKIKVISEKTIALKGTLNTKTLRNINILLLQYLTINMNNIFTCKQINKINSLFQYFSNKHFNSMFRKLWKKEILIIKYMTKLYINKFKSHIYLPALKSFLNNIYNKKVQLNIINQKYLHLNSDLFTEIVSIKLRDRTKSLFKIMLKSFLVRTFKPNKRFLYSEQKKNSIIINTETYFGRYNVINGNVLNIAFRKMFKNNMSAEKLKGNIKNTLFSLKYKWITGIRLEAAGRLTRRYAAARAVFKYKYRGSLKNLEHLKNVQNKLQSPNIFLLRGDIRPNIQHSFVPSKRRIGAFGLKSWISSS